MKSLKQALIAFILMVVMLFSVSFTNGEIPPPSGGFDTKVTKEISERNFKLILDNLDIAIEDLEDGRYLGMLYDCALGKDTNESRLYIAWVTKMIESNEVTMLQFDESGKSYNYYWGLDAAKNKEGNWPRTLTKAFPEKNRMIHLTAVGGKKEGKPFGLPLKQKYQLETFYYGVEGSLDLLGLCNTTISFNLMFDPNKENKDSLSLITHNYAIIKECEAQSTYDLLAHLGYQHQVVFNTKIPIDKIYRVDVNYTLTNDEPQGFWDSFRPQNDRLISKSLTAKRVSGGIFNLYTFQGFEEGSFQSTVDGSKNYKYKLNLSYDDNAWDFFSGKEFVESDYKRVSKFKILRLNYVVDNLVYDVPVQMDAVEGETLNPLSPDRVLNTDSWYYGAKNAWDDFWADITSGDSKIGKVIMIVLGCLLGIFILALVIRFFKFIGWIIGPSRKDKNNE